MFVLASIGSTILEGARSFSDGRNSDGTEGDGIPFVSANAAIAASDTRIMWTSTVPGTVLARSTISCCLRVNGPWCRLRMWFQSSLSWVTFMPSACSCLEILLVWPCGTDQTSDLGAPSTALLCLQKSLFNSA